MVRDKSGKVGWGKAGEHLEFQAEEFGLFQNLLKFSERGTEIFIILKKEGRFPFF